jgi:hypothetical protein
VDFSASLIVDFQFKSAIFSLALIVLVYSIVAEAG